MSDEAKFTQADVDKAIKDALAAAKVEWDAETQGLKDKNRELLGKLRAAGEIKPEDLAAAEDRAEKAEQALAEANKQVKTLTTERDKAVKALETEQGAARSYALEAELASAIAEGNVVPALVPAFKAMVAQQAKADLVDGAYKVTIGDKPAREHIKAFLESDDGKAFRTAAINSGGGASGGGNGGGSGKTITKSDYETTINSGDVKAIGAMNQAIREGAKVVDQAA